MKPHGARIWVFADGFLPASSSEGSRLEAHEALMILNTAPTPAHVELDFYFEDRPPVKGVPVEVLSERVVCLRMDRPEQIGGTRIAPLTQYALRLRSDIEVVAQFGRLDTTQSNLAYYVNFPYTSRE